MAAYNLSLLGLHNAQFVNGDGVAYLQAMPPTDFILLDPARRDGAGRKVVSLADCEPNVMDILPLLREKARYTLLKLANARLAHGGERFGAGLRGPRLC